MNFSSAATAEIEGLLEANRDCCEQQMAEKAPSVSLPNKSEIAQVISLVSLLIIPQPRPNVKQKDLTQQRNNKRGETLRETQGGKLFSFEKSKEFSPLPPFQKRKPLNVQIITLIFCTIALVAIAQRVRSGIIEAFWGRKIEELFRAPRSY